MRDNIKSPHPEVPPLSGLEGLLAKSASHEIFSYCAAFLDGALHKF